MDIEHFRSSCLTKKGVTEEVPFGPDVLVYKVMGKIFALSPIEPFDRVSLKVDPEIGADLRERYEAVKPGYHLNKKHWITVSLDGSVSDKLLFQWTDNSYNLVAASLTKSQKTTLESM
jgi:predicted DNA-binding protein (MmcQ/YjbR family)